MKRWKILGYFFGPLKGYDSTISVHDIKEAITQGNFEFLYKFLHNDSYLQKFIQGDPDVYHKVLHYLIRETFTIKDPTIVYKTSGCTVPDAESKFKEILLHLISVGKDKHFKIKRKVRIPLVFDEPPWEGQVTLLMDATLQKASYEVICALINAGSDVNASTEDGTPLIYALKYHYDINVLTELIKKGANVNQKDHHGWSPLFHAVNYDRKIIINCNSLCNCHHVSNYVMTLISAGANVCERDKVGRNILMCCTCNCINKYDCTAPKENVELLIKNGININNDVDKSGNRLIHTTSCRYLLNLTVEYGVEAKNHQGLTGLMKATISGNVGKVNYLLLSGANPNCVDRESNTPLHCIFKHLRLAVKNYSVVNSLLFFGADLNFRNAKGETPLDLLFNNDHYFCYNRNCDDNDNIILGSLKYFLLFNEKKFKIRNYIFSLCYFERSRFNAFVVKCKEELYLMQNMYLKNGLTYYDFCILKKFYNSKCVSISKDDYILKCRETEKLFPCYKDIINIRLKDCYSKTKRKKYLLGMFDRITLRPYKVTESDAHIQLVFDCLYHVCRHLGAGDVYNIFSAAVGNPQA